MLILPGVIAEKPLDVAVAPGRRELGTGEYLGAKVGQGFDQTTTRMLLDETEVAHREREAYGQRPADPTSPQDSWLIPPEDAEERYAAARMSREQWEASRYHRKGIQWREDMTPVRAEYMAEEYDKRRYRQSIIDRADPGALGSVLGFGAQLLGNLPDPINFIPFLGPAPKAMTLARAAGRGAAEAAIGTAVADSVVLPDLARRGEDVGWQDAAMDVMFGALTGGAFGAAGKALRDRVRRGASVDMRRDTARATETVLQQFAAGEPVDVAPVLRDPQSRALDEAGRLYDIYHEAKRAGGGDPHQPETVIRSLEAKEFDVRLEEAVVDRGTGKLKEDGETTFDAGFGLVKVIYKHGEMSGEPARRKVRLEDVLALPRVLRQFMPSVVKEAEDGVVKWNWAVRREDGRKVVYSLKTFTEGDGRPHLVTMYVAKKSEKTPLSKKTWGTRKKVDAHESPAPVLFGDEDTAGDLIVGSSRSRDASTDPNYTSARERVNWGVERQDPPPREAVEAKPAVAEDAQPQDTPELDAVRGMLDRGELAERDVLELREADDVAERAGKWGEAALTALECLFKGGGK